MTQDQRAERSVRFCEHTVDSPEVLAGLPISKWHSAREVLAFDEASSWTQADIAVMHVDETELKAVERKWRESYGRDSTFVVARVTKEGRETFETARHLQWKEGSRTAFVLHVRNYNALETDEEVRKALLSITPQEAMQVYEEALDGLPEAVRSTFEVPSAGSMIPALAILCQGYLSVQDETDEEVRVAQQHMGWSSQRAIPEPERARRRAEVAAPGFWAPLLRDPEDLEGSRAALRAEIEREWNALGDVATSTPDALTELIEELGEAVTRPTLVARAYLAIESGLRTPHAD